MISSDMHGNSLFINLYKEDELSSKPVDRGGVTPVLLSVLSTIEY